MYPITFLPAAKKYLKKLNDKQLKKKFENALIRVAVTSTPEDYWKMQA